MTALVDPVVPLVVFHAGPWRFAVEARHVVAMAPATMEAVEGALLLAPPGGRPMRLLALKDGRRLAAEEPVAARDVAATQIHPLPPAMAARLDRPEVRALLWDADGLVVIADPARLPPSVPA